MRRGNLGRPLAGRPTADPILSDTERAVVLSPSFGEEERITSFPEPKGFGPADGRPAGGGARLGRGRTAIRRRLDGLRATPRPRHASTTRATLAARVPLERRLIALSSATPPGGGEAAARTQQGAGAGGPSALGCLCMGLVRLSPQGAGGGAGGRGWSVRNALADATARAAARRRAVSARRLSRWSRCGRGGAGGAVREPSAGCADT